MQSAGHGDHIHVQAVLPGAVKSNIFDSAGGVDPDGDGDIAVAEAQRAAMLAVKAAAMDPEAAAAAIFEQAPTAGSICSPNRSRSGRQWRSGRIFLRHSVLQRPAGNDKLGCAFGNPQYRGIRGRRYHRGHH